MILNLELWVDGGWQLAGQLENLDDTERGYLGKVALEYDVQYATANLGVGGSRAMSCRYPPSFELWIEAPWPAFVFDILPAGAARRSILSRDGRSDNRVADWPLLARAHFPPGNLRVQPTNAPSARHEGFDRAEIIARGPAFVDYAFERGASVAGSSGAQGEAPKFLLSEDLSGRWHSEGSLPDEQVAAHWLVKFPRGRDRTDFQILEEEARYMELARLAGLRANAPLTYENGCLFVPRFDRHAGSRLGLETIASLSGITGYGVAQPLQASAAAIAAHCSAPALELCELLRRDIFNLAVGNPDNHIRNTSVLKHPNGVVALSPVYDVAPMMLDLAGIPRSSRWGPREPRAGDIDWRGVVDDLEVLGAPSSALLETLAQMAEVIETLGKQMSELGVDRELGDRLAVRHRRMARELADASGS